MSQESFNIAKKEISASLILNRYCMNFIGISFDDPTSKSDYIRQKVMFAFAVWTICYHVFSEIAYIFVTLSNSPRVEDIVPAFHTFGYGALGITKLLVLWYKKDVFKQLIFDLAEIWPIPPLEYEAQQIKFKSLAALRLAHRWYFAVNIIGVWFYGLTPIILYFYYRWQNLETNMGFVWMSWYPFDKRQRVAHIAVYIFETIAGFTSVSIMVGTDLLFSAMASHIALLLRLLHRRVEHLDVHPQQSEAVIYQEIVRNIKLHQRLIRYCKDLDVAYSLSNLVNIVLSSANICCVVFVILLLEPFFEISNKLFLGSALIQILMLCWYADDIFHANAQVSAAAYNSGWYRTSPLCQRALLFLIKRSQKPISFSAMGFTNITLVTYSSILARSYSYFALLYTMYSK